MAVGVGLLVPAPAAYASDQLQVRYAGSVSEDLGTLQVGAESGSDITEVEAHLVSYASGKEVAVVRPAEFELTSGDSRSGVWRTKEPLVLDELGTYRIDVELTDADGDHIVTQSAGDFAYYIVAKFGSLTVDRTAVDRDHRDVTVQGTLYGRWPTRDEKPLAGRSVDIDVDYGTRTTVTTDGEGRFTATVRLDEGAPIQAVFRNDGGQPFVIYGESEPVQIGVDQTPTRITADVSATDVDDGQSVTLTAKVEQYTADGWVPLANRSGGVLFGPDENNNDVVERFTTGDDGTFSVTYTPGVGGYFQLALDTSDDPFLQAATGVSAVVHVHHGAKFTDFSAVRVDGQSVRAEGHMVFPDGFEPATVNVSVQRSTDGETWTDLNTVEAHWDGTGNYFTADVDGNGPGYYRAAFAGGPNFQDATTQSVFVGG
jgi:hypothetical protein